MCFVFLDRPDNGVIQFRWSAAIFSDILIGGKWIPRKFFIRRIVTRQAVLPRANPDNAVGVNVGGKDWIAVKACGVFRVIFEMGKGIFGIEAATQAYFNTSAKYLSREQAAKIIACLPNPKRFTVVPLSRRVAWRYPQILREMNNISDDEDVMAIVK